MDDLIEKMHTNPKRIFNLPEQPETWVEVDENAEYEIHAAEQFTAAAGRRSRAGR